MPAEGIKVDSLIKQWIPGIAKKKIDKKVDKSSTVAPVEHIAPNLTTSVKSRRAVKVGSPKTIPDQETKKKSVKLDNTDNRVVLTNNNKPNQNQAKKIVGNPVLPKKLVPISAIAATKAADIDAVANKNSVWLKPVLIMLSIILVLAIGGGAIWFTVQNQLKPSAKDTMAVVSLVDAQKSVAVTLPDHKNELLSALNITKQGALAGLTNIYVVKDDVSGSQNLATTDEILKVLDWRIQGSFTRSITDLEFGVRHDIQTSPYVILKTNNFDAARAGMFNWENTISEDLTPFFGSVVTGSLRPTDSINSQAGVAGFVDSNTDNRPVRVLYDETRRERIVYGTFNQNLVIITTNRTDWLELINLLQP